LEGPKSSVDPTQRASQHEPSHLNEEILPHENHPKAESLFDRHHPGPRLGERCQNPREGAKNQEQEAQPERESEQQRRSVEYAAARSDVNQKSSQHWRRA